MAIFDDQQLFSFHGNLPENSDGGLPDNHERRTIVRPSWLGRLGACVESHHTRPLRFWCLALVYLVDLTLG